MSPRSDIARVLALAAACGCITAAASVSASSVIAPITVDPSFAAVAPEVQDGSGNDQGVYLPILAPPASVIFGTVIPDEGSSSKTFYVGAVDNAGATHYWKSTTDEHGWFRFRLPTPGSVIRILVFKHFDANGKPDRGAEMTVTDKPIQLGDMQPVIGYPASGLAIVEGNTSYQRGGYAQGIVQLHTRGLDPIGAHLLLDGSSADVDTLAASESSIVGRLRDSAALGKRLVSVGSGTGRTNGFFAYVIALTFSQLAPVGPGDAEPLSMQADGLGKDPAVARFEVTGAASLADGSPSATVPIVGGRSQVTLRGQRTGRLQVRVTIDVEMPLVSVNADSRPRQ